MFERFCSGRLDVSRHVLKVYPVWVLSADYRFLVFGVFGETIGFIVLSVNKGANGDNGDTVMPCLYVAGVGKASRAVVVIVIVIVTVFANRPIQFCDRV